MQKSSWVWIFMIAGLIGLIALIYTEVVYAVIIYFILYLSATMFLIEKAYRNLKGIPGRTYVLTPVKQEKLNT